MLVKRAAILPLVLVLASCGKTEEPTGQVVATIDGDEITVTDLEAELNGASAPNPEQQKALQRMALENIINRKILAKAAEEQGLDKGPKAAVLMDKARDLALIELLNEKTRTGIPAPSDEEIKTFVDGNPAQFSQHRLYVVDQLIVPRATEELAKALQPVSTMAEAEQVLSSRNVPSTSTVGVIDSLTMPPEVAKQIAALPPDEVFIIPSNGGIRINHVRSSQLSPISSEQAMQIGREMLTKQRVEGQTRNELSKSIEAGRANVKYNAEFAPPKGEATPSSAAAAQGAQSE